MGRTGLLAAICFTFTASVVTSHAQTFGAMRDSPQHVFDAGGGFDGNGDAHMGGGYAEKIVNGLYSRTSVDFVPGFAQTTAGVTAISIKPVTTTGAEWVAFQSGRFSIVLGGQTGAGLPAPGSNSVNLAGVERVTASLRIGALRSGAGSTNNYLFLTPYSLQIRNVPNGNTWGIQVHWGHGVN